MSFGRPRNTVMDNQMDFQKLMIRSVTQLSWQLYETSKEVGPERVEELVNSWAKSKNPIFEVLAEYIQNAPEPPSQPPNFTVIPGGKAEQNS